jgi:hypothetical protein
MSMCRSTHSNAYYDDHYYVDEDCQQSLDCGGQLCSEDLKYAEMKLTFDRR